MTTIACRDGMMAADSQGRRGSVKTEKTKIFRICDEIIGLSGNYADGLVFVDWWGRGHPMDNLPEFRQYGRSGDEPDFNALVLNSDGLAEWTEFFQPIPIIDKFFAIGSGAMAATAAMHMGADAFRAIEIAALVDADTGGEIQVERLADARFRQ